MEPDPAVTSTTVELADGTTVVIRPLLASDRDELAAAYEQLSPTSRYRRFFSPPKHLSPAWLDYLTNLDYDRHFALAAYTEVDGARRGLGVARWVRDRAEPSCADAAITVVDDWQQRGIGTALLDRLIVEARARGISTFTADVLWENHELLDGLRAVGARVTAGEPGLARVHVDLPPDATVRPGTPVHDVLRIAGAEPPVP